MSFGRTIRTPLYPVRVHVVVGSQKDAIEYLKSKKLNDAYKDVNLEDFHKSYAVTYPLNSSKKGEVLILFNPKRNGHLKKDVLAHELIHVTMFVFHYIGTDMNDHTEEPFCYLFDYLFTKVNKILDDFNTA